MMTFNKDEYKALYIGRKIKSTQIQWGKYAESDPKAPEDLKVFMSQQTQCCYKKANNLLGSLQSTIKTLTEIKCPFLGISL